MAPNAERTATDATKSKMLTMDVIELTLLLKSIGFRLESIDYDELRCWHKNSGEHGNGNGNGIGAFGGSAATDSNSTRTDADQHCITVEISCSKSKIVSNLSLKFNETDASAVDVHSAPDSTTATTAAAAAAATKSIACTCPKREPANDNSSFWEVQSSGTFANPKRLSINALMGSEIDHDTSSNLLPVLSTKSIALTHVLTQVLLNQYKNNTQFGEASAAKDVDIKSIMRTIENVQTVPVLANGDRNGVLPIANPTVELNLITPSSSMNVTPTEPESLMNVTMPKVVANGQMADDTASRNAALNDTVNTEAFSSPKSDLITSSPHSSQTYGQCSERDSNIVSNLNAARRSIDQALLSMQLNDTRNLTQELLPSSLLTATKKQPTDNNRNRSTIAPPQLPRVLNGRTAAQASTNARSTISALNRRASLGSIGSLGKMGSPAIVSRFNMPKPTSAERPAGGGPSIATSKLALVRRAVSGIGNRTINSITTSVKTQNPTSTTPTSATSATSATLKRPSSLTRRGSVSSTGTPTATTSTIRKTVSTAKTLIPSKLAKK